MINATLFGQMITFAIFVWFTQRFVWPHLQSAMEERRASIEKHMQEAEARVKASRDQEAELLEQSRAFQKEQQTLREEAQKERQDLLQKARLAGEAQKSDIVAQATADIEQARLQAKEALAAEVSEHVVAGVRKVLGQAMTPELNEVLIKQWLDQEEARD